MPVQAWLLGPLLAEIKYPPDMIRRNGKKTASDHIRGIARCGSAW